MAFPLPSGHLAEELARLNDLSRLSDLKPVEEAQAEGTRMLWGFSFQWRFPLFDTLAGGLNWTLRQAGVTPWPGTQDIVFVEATEAVWYIAWLKGAAWLAPIIAALAPILAIMAAVFLGSVLWRVVPQPLRQPVEQTLALLPLALVMGVMAFLPQVTRMLAPEEEV